MLTKLFTGLLALFMGSETPLPSHEVTNLEQSSGNCLDVNPWLQNIDDNTQPVIGVVSQTFRFGGEKFEKYQSYIMAAYVRFLEGSGARVIPILMSDSEETVLEKLSQINGVLIPGGAGNYRRVGSIILREAMKKNDRGEFFPVYGICLGFEFLSKVTAEQSSNVLENIYAKKISLPLKFMKDPRKTKMFCQLGGKAKEFAEGHHFFNMHKYGVRPETFDSDPQLKKFWDVTSVSTAPDGTVFANTIEAKNYPIMATMFHPEKITTMFNDNAGLNHTW